MAADDAAPGTFSPPAPAPAAPAPGGGTDDFNQLMQWLMSAAGGGAGGGAGAGPLGGGMGLPGPGIGGGGNQIMDALGLGGAGMGDPLQGGMINPLGGNIGLNPYQAAKLRMMRNAKMNVLRQNMANAHRGVGRFGGTDFSRHVQNIDDELLANSEQMVQDNVKNALAYNDQLMRYGQQNLANNAKLFEAITGMNTRALRFGGAKPGDEDASPGTYSGGEDQGQ